MPKRADPLTPSAVANAKPQAKPYKMPDGRGMFLLVNADGSSVTSRSKEIAGNCRCGSARGISPKVDAMVATPAGSSSTVAAVAASIASSGPGTRDRPGMRGPHSASARLRSVRKCSWYLNSEPRTALTCRRAIRPHRR